MTLVYLRHNRLQLGYDITASDWAIIPYIWHVWLIIFWSVILLLAYMIWHAYLYFLYMIISVYILIVWYTSWFDIWHLWYFGGLNSWLARMKVHSLQTVGELITAIKTAARADDLNMNAGLQFGGVRVSINSREMWLDYSDYSIYIYGLD